MDCNYCNEELLHHDSFGKRMWQQDQDKLGNIYICENEECQAFEERFYSLESEQHNELHEGSPC